MYIKRNECNISDLKDFLQIRYIKLHFSLEILREGILPKNKASALRGGMGHMLLLMYCAMDENCDACDFARECTVRRIMYPEMEICPSFMTQKDSEGYVLECEDYAEEYADGDILEFNLVLFGKTIVYFSHFLRAFCYLGNAGIGKEHIPFRVKCVTNTYRELLYDGDSDTLYKDRYRIHKVADYVDYRLSQAKTFRTDRILFHTPLSLKYKGEFQNRFDPEAILAAVERRIYILNCFEGTTKAVEGCRIGIDDHIPAFEDEWIRVEKVPRYSGTQNSLVVFTGIRGYCKIVHIDHDTLKMLIAGELMHIGKNTSFGFGRYTLV